MPDLWKPLPRYSLRKYLVMYVIKKLDPESKSCLEIGYGPGDMLIDFAKTGMDTHGYDFSIEAYKNAKQRIEKQPAHIKKKIHLLTSEKQTFSSRYDVIVALEVLEHVKDDIALLSVLKNHLKKNGFLILSVPAHKDKWGANDVWAGHYRRYEKDELQKKLELSGLKTDHIWSYGYPLILLLDKAIHRNRKKGVKQIDLLSKEELTKQSGISRKDNLINWIASWKIWVLPFFYIQRVFLEFDLTSAFLIIARKNDE